MDKQIFEQYENDFDVNQMVLDDYGEFDLIHDIHFNYVALQHGMELAGVIDGDLRRMVSEYNVNKFGLEDLINMHPAEQYRAFIESTPYGFALEGLESILDWGIWSQAAFCAFFPGGFLIWSLALIERIWRESAIIIEEREKLREQGFYAPGANPDDFRSTEDMTDKQVAKYQNVTVKAYSAKLLLEKLEASYTLMRIFCDTTTNNTQLKPRQLVPSLKKLGYVVNESNGKINKDPAKKEVKDTMQNLGYGDPSFIKQIFVKTTPHTDLLPTFRKSMERLQEEQKNKESVLEKVKRFFKVDSKEKVSKQDKAAIALVAHALKVTLEETDILFKQSIQLMGIVKRYDK